MLASAETKPDARASEGFAIPSPSLGPGAEGLWSRTAVAGRDDSRPLVFQSFIVSFQRGPRLTFVVVETSYGNARPKGRPGAFKRI